MKNKFIKTLTLILAVCAISCFGLACLPNQQTSGDHVHYYGTYKFDVSGHWLECECGDRNLYFAHEYTEGRCLCGFIDPNYTPEVHIHSFTVKSTVNDFIKTPATCEAKAVYYYSCFCGEKGTETFEVGNPLGHKFTNYIDNNDDTKTATCDNGCGKTNTINKDHVHNYIADVTEPTCINGGYTTYTCECSDSYVDDEIEPLGHDYSENVIVYPRDFYMDNNYIYRHEVRGWLEATCARCKGYGGFWIQPFIPEEEMSSYVKPENIKLVQKSGADENCCLFDCVYNHNGIDYTVINDISIYHHSGNIDSENSLGVIQYFEGLGIDLKLLNAQSLNCQTATNVSYKCHCGQNFNMSIKAPHDIDIDPYSMIITKVTDLGHEGIMSGWCNRCEEYGKVKTIVPHKWQIENQYYIIYQINVNNPEAHVMIDLYCNICGYHQSKDGYAHVSEIRETECGPAAYIELNWGGMGHIDFNTDIIDKYFNEDYSYKPNPIDDHHHLRFEIVTEMHEYMNWETLTPVPFGMGQQFEAKEFFEDIGGFIHDELNCDTRTATGYIQCNKCHEEIPVIVNGIGGNRHFVTSDEPGIGLIRYDVEKINSYEVFMTAKSPCNFDVELLAEQVIGSGDWGYVSGTCACDVCNIPIYFSIAKETIPVYKLESTDRTESFDIREIDAVSLEVAKKLGYTGELASGETDVYTITYSNALSGEIKLCVIG